MDLAFEASADYVQLVPTVFIVDGEAGAKKFARQVVEDLGFRAKPFDRAEELLDSGELRQCSVKHPDHIRENALSPMCILLEASLSGMSGFELQDFLAAKRMQIPIIFVSRAASINEAVQAMRRGAEYFFEKPLCKEKLSEAIRAAISQDASLRFQRLESLQTRERLATLSERERQVLDRLIISTPVKKIASQLGTSPHTVRSQRTAILQKLHGRDDADLVRIMLSLRFRESQLEQF